MSEWNSSLLGDWCSDFKVCLAGWFCGTCELTYQQAALEQGDCSVCTWFIVAPELQCAVMNTRASIRHKYGIEGSLCGDYWTSFCCTPCAIAQQSRELNSRGATPAGMCNK